MFDDRPVGIRVCTIIRLALALFEVYDHDVSHCVSAFEGPI